jgi:hypothetical protein
VVLDDLGVRQRQQRPRQDERRGTDGVGGEQPAGRGAAAYGRDDERRGAQRPEQVGEHQPESEADAQLPDGDEPAGQCPAGSRRPPRAAADAVAAGEHRERQRDPAA